eukprot:TRINITY_DN3670_c0_g1_i1.p1 TRINITY_DN3670_c0_g1~~TRINITY_DN3670_c0_g1_i1.p1  ORF type:complete len:247 (+),score=45.58 TRINITY_DN3670_c0_g1_i1:46-741(+)
MNYYTHISNTIDSMKIIIGNPTFQHFVVYVNRGTTPPTPSRYDYNFHGYDDQSFFTIDNVGSQTWSIAIGSEYTGSLGYNITVTEDISCDLGCNYHGICSEAGLCICDDGFTGPNCEYQLGLLINNQIQQGFLNSSGSYNYYNFTANASSYHFVLKEEATYGSLNLFVNVGYNPPTSTVYDYADANFNVVHIVSFSFDTAMERLITIGVYEVSWTLTYQVPYSIIASATDF